MADLLFKRGLYSNLHNVAVTDGAVYFTTDTHELYFDEGTTRHRIQDTMVVATLAEVSQKYPLATDKAALDGRLIYVTDGNILMTYDADDKKFVQINAQKTLTQLLNQEDFVVNATSAQEVTITHTIGVGADAITDSFNIITTTPNMIQLSAAGDDTLKIEVTEYRESASVEASSVTDGAKIQLTSIKETMNPDGTVKATETVATSDVTIKHAGDFVTVSQNEGVITVDADASLDAVAESDGLAVKLYGKDNKEVSSKTIAFKVTYNDDSATTFTNQGTDIMVADLDVYTTAQIDDKVNTLNNSIKKTKEDLEDVISESLEAANAMTFKGTVAVTPGSGATKTGLPTSGVKIGDMYKVAEDGTYTLSTSASDTKYAVVGDLFIATSTTNAENTAADENSMVITPTEVKWVHVPSGDDAMYQLWAAQDRVSLGVDNEDLGKGQIIAGTAIKIDATTAQKATIRHDDVSHENTTGAATSERANTAASFTAITGLTVNAQGHVTGIEKSTFSTLGFVPDVEQELGAITNGIKVKAVATYTDANDAVVPVTNLEVGVVSTNLTVSAKDEGTIQIEHPEYEITPVNADPVTDIEALTVVTGIEYNKLGHLTGISTGGITVEALAPTALNATITANEAHNGATLAITETYGENDTTTEVAFTSSTLEITNPNDGTSNVAINLVWGTF